MDRSTLIAAVLRPRTLIPPSMLGSFRDDLLAAYSPRARLLGSYSGPLLRVKRDADDAEDDFGFGDDGLLDEAALTEFVGEDGIGYVMTIYDQLEAADLVQQSIQWRIVSSGAIVKLNDTPIMWSTSANTSYLSDSVISHAGMTYCGIARWTLDAGAIFQVGTLNTNGSVFRSTNATARGQSGGDATVAASLNTLYQVSAEITNARRQIWIGGSAGTENTNAQTVGVTNGTLRLGAVAASTSRMAGYFGDQIFCSTLSDVQRQAIEAALSEAYGL